MTANLIKTLLVSYLFFLICLLPTSVYSLFFYNLTFLISGSYFFMHFVFSVTLSLLLLCLSSFSFSCYFVFMSFCLSYYFAFISFCLFCYSVSFHLFVALPLFFFPSHFGFIFTLSSVYFLIFLPEYLSI